MFAAILSTIGGPRVSLDAMSASIFDIQIGVDAGAALEIQADGDIIESTNTLGPIDTGDWIAPKAAAGSAYEVRATITDAGSLSTGTTGTWLSLGSSRSWSAVQSGDGVTGAELLIEIRQASSGAVLASKTTTISASVGA